MNRVSTIAGAVAAVTLFPVALAGCGDDGENRESGASVADVDLVAPEEFAERMTDPDAVFVNVHVPYEGEIAGTDLFIPFDEIASSAELPSDRDRPLLVYCRTGSMSATAAADLVDTGHTSVTELDGGMVAWQAADRSIENAPEPTDTPRLSAQPLSSPPIESARYAEVVHQSGG